MFKTFLLGVLILSILSPPSLYASPENATALFSDALNLEKSLQVFSARRLFADALASAPDNIGYQEHNAWFLNEHGFSEEAEAAFLRLSKIKPSEDVYRGLGWNELSNGRYSAAIESYNHIYPGISTKYTKPQAIVEIRRNLNNENTLKTSKLILQLSQDPSDINARKELFRMYANQGKWESAKTLGKQIRNLAPDDLHFQWEFARMLYWGGDLEHANAEFTLLTTILPNNPFIIWELSKVQFAQSKYEDARKNLELALSLAPDTSEIIKDLAELNALNGDEIKAIALVKLLTNINKQPLITLLTEARCYHFLGKHDTAASRYRKILSIYPENIEALWGLAETALNTGSTDESAKIVTNWESIKPDDSRLKSIKAKLKNINSPKFSIIADVYSNSNKYLRINSGIALEKLMLPDQPIRIGYNFSLFRQRGFNDINRHSVFLQTEKQLKLINLNARIDGNFYDNQNNQINVRASATLIPDSSRLVKLSYDHIDIIDTEQIFGNQLYNYVVSIGSVALNLTTNDYSIYLKQSFLKEFDLWAKLTYGIYSDENRKLGVVTGFDYNPKAIPGLKAYYSYFYLDYERPAVIYITEKRSESAYFDPSHLSVHTTGASYQKKLENFTYGGDLSLSYLPCNSGIGYTIAGFIGLNITDSQKLRCEARYFYQNRGENRQSSSGHFSAEHILLAYEIIF